MMHSTGNTTKTGFPKDLVSRNGIYYLVSDVIKQQELGMNEVLTQYNMRVIVSTNYAADPLWAKLQTYDPVTHEPIPRNITTTTDHSSTTSSVESYSPQPSQSLPTNNNNNISTTPVENVPTPITHIPTSTISTTSPQQQQQIPQTTTTTTITQPTTTPTSFSIPSIATAHLSPPTLSNSSTNAPHIAKSFRSPPPSDYFVNNAANLSYLSISQYFKLPLHEACVALRVDESSLKKRCRELGIRRWPYRKRCNITSGKGTTQTQQVEEQSGSGDQLFSCFQLNKGKGSPVVQKMKSEEALALEALDKLHNVNRSANTVTSTVPTTTTATSSNTTTSVPTTTTIIQQQPQPQQPTHGIVAHQPPRPVPQPTAGTAYSYPPYPPHPGYPHMYPPHPGYHYPYGVPPTHDGSQPVAYPMYYPPQTSVPPGAYPPQPTESKDGQPQPYVQPYYYDYRYPYPPPQSGTVPPYPYPPQPGYSYPPHPDQATYPYPPHGYPMAYPPHQMGYPPQPVPPQQVPQKLQTTPVIVSTSPAESQPVSGTPCRTVSSSTSNVEPTTPVGSPQTKMVYQRETKVLHPVRYKPPSPTETTAEIAAKIKRERLEEQEEAAKKVRRDIQIANPTCSKPVSSQTVQNGSISTSIKVAEK